jgi:hypothetical protein
LANIIEIMDFVNLDLIPLIEDEEIKFSEQNVSIKIANYQET